MDIDICVLSEIFNIDELNDTNILNYNIISKKRIKKHIKFKKLNFQSLLDILVCQTFNLSYNLVIVSIYFPHSIKSCDIKNELEKLLCRLESKSNVFMCGDFNARHSGTLLIRTEVTLLNLFLTLLIFIV